MTVAIAVQILLDCGTESSPAETKVPNVYVSFVWCFVLEKPLEVISSLRSPGIIANITIFRSCYECLK